MCLPVLFPEDTARRSTLSAAEEGVMDVAESLVSQGVTGPVAEHAAAVRLANELMWAHESGHPADAPLHAAANQLKCWHLNQLVQILANL